MRLDWLEDLLAVAEAGSLAEAAERRHLSPSAFSRRIRAIEDALGAPLLDRARKPVRLLPTALEHRDRMAEVAGALRQLRDDLRRGAHASGRRIVLASQHALATSVTPGLVRAIRARHPEAHVRLRSANLDGCLALLLAGQADVALVYRVPGEPHPVRTEFVETLAIGADRLVPVAGAGAAASLLEGGAEGISVVAYPGDVFLGQAMERHVLPRLDGRRRLVPRVETALTHAALELAAEGIGIAWVPASLAASRIAQGGLVDLSDRLPGCDLTVTAVRLAGRPGALAEAVWRGLAGPGI